MENNADIHPLWERVRNLFFEYFSCAEVPKVEWQKPTRVSVDCNARIKQGLGNLAIAAVANLETAKSPYLRRTAEDKGLLPLILTPFILLHLESFAIVALFIYFSIFGGDIERSDSDNMLVSQDFLPEFALPAITPNLERTHHDWQSNTTEHFLRGTYRRYGKSLCPHVCE
jgi:hypothetical protein